MNTCLVAIVLGLAQGNPNRVENSNFEAYDAKLRPVGYQLSGNVVYGKIGYNDEFAGLGVWFDGNPAKGEASGTVAQVVRLDPNGGRWITFRVRGKAEDGFSVSGEQLFMKLDFLAKGGTQYEDSAKRLIWREVQRDRQDLAVNGDNRKNGAAVWRTYEFEERLPFSETDAVRATLGFAGGVDTNGKFNRFFATDFAVTQATASRTGKREPVATSRDVRTPSDLSQLVALGGRWYYAPATGEKVAKRLVVSWRNADRLFYKDGGLSAPFAGNMDATMRPGFLDANGKMVTKTTYVPDSVVVEFDGSGYWTIHAKNIPNHPTAKFPDTAGTQGYNPNYIMAHDYTYRLPIEPKRDPAAFALPISGKDNGALHMGSIGFAINGVAFYNPYDAGSQDATGIMDRCCGHPSPDYRYHYHKYPICVNTPFVDKGEGHSPLIGWAFDGFPIYGPYESKGILARDSTTNPLNSFNAHYDVQHGWHYHVTPGKFPYIIGGFLGYESRQGF